MILHVSGDHKWDHLLPLVEALVSEGNEPIGEGFRPNQGGWDCEMRNPLDFDALRTLIDDDPHEIVVDWSGDRLDCRHCWAGIYGPGRVRLPVRFHDQVQGFPETHMGAQTVVVTLRDGRVFTGVHIASRCEVVKVEGEVGIPFTSEEVVAVDDASGLT